MTAAAAPSLPSATGRCGSVDELHARLLAWVQDVLGDVAVTLEPPASGLKPSRCIGLYLMGLAAAPRTRDARTPSLQLNLRYLVTAWGGDVLAMHNDLSDLAFSALEDAKFEVDFEPLPPTAWAAFGVPPRPAFMLLAPLRKARDVSVAQAVRSPLVIAPAPLARLDGLVLGPRDTPVADARIELASLGLATRSDAHGAFSFMGIPAAHPLRLRVRARGVEQVFALEACCEPGQRVPLRMSGIGGD